MRTKPTKARLNQAVRADIPGGDFLLDMMKDFYLARRFPSRYTNECNGLFDFLENRFKSIRAKMRAAVIDRENGIAADPSDVCKSLAGAVADDLHNRLKDSWYCKRKKLKQDHKRWCARYRDGFRMLIEAIDGLWVKNADGLWVELPKERK